MVLTQLYSTCKRIKVNPHLTPYVNMKSKWIIDLKLRVIAIRLLEENRNKFFPDFGLDSGFLGMTSKLQVTRK